MVSKSFSSSSDLLKDLFTMLNVVNFSLVLGEEPCKFMGKDSFFFEGLKE